MKNGIITTDSIRRANGFVKVDEAYYCEAPEEIDSRVLFESLVKACRKPAIKMLGIEPNPALANATIDDFAREFSHHHGEDNPPEWLQHFPSWIQRLIVRDSLIKYAVESPIVIMTIAHAGIGAVIEGEGFVGDTCRAFNVWRLGRINQLSYLRHPSVKQEYGYNHGTSLPFSTTRLLHSDTVFLLGNLMIENNPELWPMKNTLKTALLTHDSKTPAGGDATKLVDLKYFDEEARFGDFAKNGAVRKHCARYGINFEMLHQTVLGKGLYGQVLDVADKIGYISPDMWRFAGGDLWDSDRVKRGQDEIEVLKLISKDPRICSVWEMFRVKNGVAYFDLEQNRERYARFWLLRALAFKGVYYNEFARVPEYIFAMTGIRDMLARGVITREWLVEATDDELEERFWKQFGFFPMTTFIPFEIVDELEFPNHDEAVAAVLRIQDESPEHICMIHRSKATTKRGYDEYPLRVGNKHYTFEQLFPYESELLKEIMTFPEIHKVFVTKVGSGHMIPHLEAIRHACRMHPN